MAKRIGTQYGEARLLKDRSDDFCKPTVVENWAATLILLAWSTSLTGKKSGDPASVDEGGSPGTGRLPHAHACIFAF